MTKAAPTPLRLIGNPSENFYILGKKHYSQFRQLQSIISPRPESWANRLKNLSQTIRAKKSVSVPQGPWEEWLNSYCEGLEIPVLNYLAFMDDIEKNSLAGGALPGCTSVFLWNDDHQRAEHLRLLDWPMSLASEQHCELILLHVPHQQALLMVCVPGLPFLPLTIMNESGVTLALHAKYHALNHPDGTPIGQIAMESMLEARSTQELKKLLKRYQTKRLWGLHGCDPSGLVLALDVMGPQMDGQNFNIQEEKILVFNNAPLVKDQPNQVSAEPPAFLYFCKERRRFRLERLKTKSEDHSLVQLTRAHKASKFRAPAVTLSCLQAMSFHPSSRRFELLLGTPPMWAQGELAAWNDLFTTSMRQPEVLELSQSKEEKQEWLTRKELSDAQKAMDLGDIALAFHHIQMGLVKAQGELKQQAAWVWAWWQWQHLSGKRDRMQLPSFVREVMKASHGQQPHLKFLLFLLEVELELAATVSPPDLPTPFREWADAYLVAPTVRRLQMIHVPQARLDIQDCLPLIIPTWTKASWPG